VGIGFAAPFVSVREGKFMQVFVSAARSALALAVSFCFIEESRANPIQVESDAGVIEMIATVEAVDVTNRLVTLVGPHGNILTVRVGPEHVDIIKVKEKITVRYADEVAVALRKYDGPQHTDGRGFVEQAEAGMDMDPPTYAEQDWIETTPTGVVDHTTIEVSDTVKSLDRRHRTITFAGKGGKTRTIRIPATLPDFDRIQPGDRVVVLVTRAVAVNVKPL
jgi:hypothetical protein